MSEQKHCNTCKRKSTCLKRSTAIFTLYIQTGRFDELTDEIRENFDCSSDCSVYLRDENTEKEELPGVPEKHKNS